MKLGIVLASTPTYSETFFTSKIKGLQKHGFKVCLFTQTASDDFTLCPVLKAPKIYKNPLVQCMAMSIVFIRLLPHFKSVIKFIRLERQRNTPRFDCLKKIYTGSHLLREKLDWLHFGFTTMALGKEHIAESIGAKMAVSLRGYDINIYPLKFPGCYDLVWKKADRIHSISHDLIHKAYKLGLSENADYQVITPAIDINLFKGIPKQHHEEPLIKILSIGRLHWVKGIDYSLQALYLLKKQGIKFLYTIVGEGEAFEQLSFLNYQLGLSDCVILKGKQTPLEITDHLNEASIYLQYSVSEGFCNAVLEAQAMGKLCIVSDAGALPENVEHLNTGWVVSKRDPQKLANTILTVSRMPEEKKEAVKKAAMERVRDQFSIEKQQQEFLKFYQEH